MIAVKRRLTDEQLNNHAWYSVYRLFDPTSLETFYIGQTAHCLETRLKGHCSNPTNPAMATKIKELDLGGLKPGIELIEDGLTWGKADRREKYWIKEFRQRGIKLLNRR